MSTTANDSVVRTQDLTKIFRDVWLRPKVRAVDGLTMDIRRGEVFGLLGPNGSGKSTTVKLLLNLLFPTSGKIAIFGLQARDRRVKRRLGFLPEETYVYPYLNARETLDFFGRLDGIPRRERRSRVDALIEMVGLSSARRRPLREYSKGMARRIGIALSLMNDPELLLFDEPTTGLDPIGTREVKDLVLSLKEKGKTILMCSHLLGDVEDVCDRIGILYGGKLCAVGTVEELLAKRQMTEITVPDLGASTLAKVRSVIRDMEGEKDIAVGHPRERLESFFLRVIEQAREEQPETAGASAGAFKGHLFEQAPEAPGDVLGRLTAPEPAEAPETAAAPLPAPDRSALDRLTAAPAKSEKPEHAGETQDDEGAADEAGRTKSSVLDRLTGQAEPEQKDAAE